MKTIFTILICCITTAILIIYLVFNDRAIVFLIEKLGIHINIAETYNNLFIALVILFINLIIVAITQHKRLILEKLRIYFISILFSFLIILAIFGLYIFAWSTQGKIGG